MTPDQQHFEEVLEGISRGSAADIKVLLASLRPSEVAGVLEANMPGHSPHYLGLSRRGSA
jgi:hypothetical protein